MLDINSRFKCQLNIIRCVRVSSIALRWLELSCLVECVNLIRVRGTLLYDAPWTVYGRYQIGLPTKRMILFSSSSAMLLLLLLLLSSSTAEDSCQFDNRTLSWIQRQQQQQQQLKYSYLEVIFMSIFTMSDCFDIFCVMWTTIATCVQRPASKTLSLLVILFFFFSFSSSHGNKRIISLGPTSLRIFIFRSFRAHPSPSLSLHPSLRSRKFQAADKTFWCKRPTHLNHIDPHVWRNLSHSEDNCNISNNNWTLIRPDEHSLLVRRNSGADTWEAANPLVAAASRNSIRLPRVLLCYCAVRWDERTIDELASTQSIIVNSNKIIRSGEYG